MTAHTLIVLARYGDILNCLPIAYAFYKRGAKLRWLVGQEHASILDGVSYVEPEIWKGSQDTLPRAIHYVRGIGQRALVAQAWKNPDQRHQTESFSLEQWRLAGMLEHYGKFPLVFDSRSPERERALVENTLQWPRGSLFPSSEKPVVLVSTTSVSTPYKYADKLIATIRGLDAEVIDMDNVRATNVFDLLGLYERADCLVSIDTMHHHLARASYLPVVYLQNDGWKGAKAVPQVRATWRYSEIEDLRQVKAATEAIIARSYRSVPVVVDTDPERDSSNAGTMVSHQPDTTSAVVVFPTYLRDGHSSQTERHLKARNTHPSCALYVEMTCRPKVRDLLEHGLSKGRDVVILTNDDVTFNDQTLPTILNHARKWDFGCSRRPEEPTHIGREIFWWRSDWLRAHINEFPDVYWTLQRVDLVLAKWMRGMLGIPTTDENLKYDFPPVEIPAGLIYHEKHESHWNAPEIFTSAESVHNDNVWNAMK